MDDLIELKREADQVLAKAELLYSLDEIDIAVDVMAVEINTALHDKNPIVLCIMQGAVIITGRLLLKLKFPLQLEYIHATRYRGDTKGGTLTWVRKPDTSMSGRTVLILDDILDEGKTLKAMVAACGKAGALEIFTAVLVDKQINKPKHFQQTDFTGLVVPDRYVFGYGMDYKGYLRNCAGIYAVKD